MLKAVIFDMDGVIIDSEPLHARAAILAMKKYNVALTEDYCYGFVGSTARHLLEVLREQYSLSASLDELMEANDRMKEALVAAEGYPAIPFVGELMAALHGAGLRLAIASSSPMEDIRETVSRLRLTDYLECLVSGMQVKSPKPAPDIFLEAAGRLGVAPSECLVIEDSCNGLNAARSAGMARVAFYNPHSGKQDLSAANYVIEGFEEITPAFLNRVYCHATGQPAEVARTDRLFLRELALSDLPALHAILNNPEIARFSGEPVRPLDERISLHKSYIHFAYRFRGFGLWGVFLKETGQLIGRCGLEEAENDSGTARIEIGYLISPEFQGCGYALESVRAVLSFAFNEQKLSEIYAVTAPDNFRSNALIQKLGFRQTGTICRNGKTCQEFVLSSPE